ncbi:MAG TPA: hypothetical protein VL328_12625 [Gemmatimonadaceae bacterium]|jgi:hypothetical protein|nr:hypothetical protein [Gemmatimonadaceae bacterium]
MHARTRYALRLALAAGLGLGAAGRPAQAQSLAPRTPPVDVAIVNDSVALAPAGAVQDSAAAGPTVDAARIAARYHESGDLKITAAPRRAGYGQPVALMVVGGAALLTGLIIGDDAGTVIAVGGALVGLYGLYEYLQ